MKILNYGQEHFSKWLSMTHILLQDYKIGDLENKLKRIEKSDKHQTFIAMDEENVIGYATTSIRSEYIEGASSSPVAYLEMIFIEENYRKKGIAKKLYESVENWALEKGFNQIGSDTWEWNKASREFHMQLGFKETEVLVHFIKDIHPPEKE
ncbi:MAG: aminoglycoside 6'-N-acetyltransferase I [Patiriisocius sp.]|jgi:aminoglycoside 6'-N-acetyltransferase I